MTVGCPGASACSHDDTHLVDNITLIITTQGGVLLLPYVLVIYDPHVYNIPLVAQTVAMHGGKEGGGGAMER